MHIENACAVLICIAVHGTFNFLLSDGDTLFAHCSTQLHYVSRAYPFARASLVDGERSIDFRHHNGPDDRMAVIASLRAPVRCASACTV